MSWQKMKTWVTIYRKAEQTSGLTRWSFRKMQKIRTSHMHLSTMQATMTELMITQAI